MNLELIVLLMFLCMMLFLLIGVPIAFAMGGISLMFGLFFIGPQFLDILPVKIFSYMSNFALIAAPLFIFMAIAIERCGIADQLFGAILQWVGFLPGGLAIGTIGVCTIFAAMSGVSAGATVSMGVIALPAMLKRGYSKDLATGCIMAGGGLGQLIPPSVFLLVVALLTSESVGRLFIAGVFPGLMLSAMFVVYIGVRAFLQPAIAPALPVAERLPWRLKLLELRYIIAPIIIVVLVLGSIFLGIASPTEAAAIGAISSVIYGILMRKFSLKDFREATYQTFKLMGFCMWIIFGASIFVSFAMTIGLQKELYNLIMMAPGGAFGIFIIIQVAVFILGCFLDSWAIIMLVVPLFAPILQSAGIDMIWFLVIFVMNLMIGFITPPFGYNIFYLRGVITKEMGISMGDLYRAVIPFVIIQLIGLALVIIFPEIILWLPNKMMGIK